MDITMTQEFEMLVRDLTDSGMYGRKEAEKLAIDMMSQ